MLFEDIVILDEIKDELFPLQDEEKRLLEESILKEGIREPLIVWIPQEGQFKGKKILVDGHNRFEIAKKHNLKFKITIKEFSDLEEVLSWVVRNQLGRRNLTDEQKRYLYGKLYNLQKKSYGDPNRFSPSAQIDHLDSQTVQSDAKEEKKVNRTADQLAKQTEYTSATIRRYGAFADSVDKVKKISSNVANKILNGEVKDALTTLPSFSRNVPENILSDVVKKLEEGKKSIKEAVKEAVKQEEIKKANNVKLPTIIDIRLGNYVNVLEDVRQVDLIVTTLVNKEGSSNEWNTLGQFAQEKLKDGGFLVVRVDQKHLFEAQTTLSVYLNYIWLFCSYIKDGPAKIMGGVNVLNGWSPIIVFGKNVKKFSKPIPDLIVSDKTNIASVKQIIESLTQVGDIVCDPFVGDATTPVACRSMDRQFVGAEPDEETYKLAILRISKEKEENLSEDKVK